MSQDVTIVTYDTTEEPAKDVILLAKLGDIPSSNFTNYENGTLVCPNGKTMKVETIEVSDNIANNYSALLEHEESY